MMLTEFEQRFDFINGNRLNNRLRYQSEIGSVSGIGDTIDEARMDPIAGHER
jgi:hypothetical protein